MYKVRWERLQKKSEEEKRREEEAERNAMSLIDWHDFVVVQTIQWEDDEEEGLDFGSPQVDRGLLYPPVDTMQARRYRPDDEWYRQEHMSNDQREKGFPNPHLYEEQRQGDRQYDLGHQHRQNEIGFHEVFALERVSDQAERTEHAKGRRDRCNGKSQRKADAKERAGEGRIGKERGEPSE